MSTRRSCRRPPRQTEPSFRHPQALDEPLKLNALRSDLVFYPVPFDTLVKPVCPDAKLRRLVRNMIYDGILAKLLGVDHIGEAQAGGSVNQREGSGGFGELLPDELEHEELVEIGVEQGSRNRIQLPIVVVGTPSEVDDHDATTLPYCVRSSETGPMALNNGIALVPLRPQTWRTSPSRATIS